MEERGAVAVKLKLEGGGPGARGGLSAAALRRPRKNPRGRYPLEPQAGLNQGEDETC